MAPALNYVPAASTILQCSYDRFSFISNFGHAYNIILPANDMHFSNTEMSNASSALQVATPGNVVANLAARYYRDARKHPKASQSAPTCHHFLFQIPDVIASTTTAT